MRTINDYIFERGSAPIRILGNENIIKKIREIAFKAIDSLTGAPGWKDTDLEEYVRGDDDPDYQEIIDEIINDAKNYPDVIKVLNKYPNTDLKDDIELAVLAACGKYIKNH